MPAVINASDLEPDQLKELGVRQPRVKAFTREHERRWSLKVLAVIAHLSQDQRSRVLKHALKVNKV
jgi:hypothetical protein